MGLDLPLFGMITCLCAWTGARAAGWRGAAIRGATWGAVGASLVVVGLGALDIYSVNRADPPVIAFAVILAGVTVVPVIAAVLGAGCGLAGRGTGRVLPRRPLNVVLGGVALACAVSLIDRATSPLLVIPVPWPDEDVIMRLELAGFPDDRWWLVARNAAGEGHLNLQKEVAIQPVRFNIYRTADGAVGVIATGGEPLLLMRIPSNAAPHPDFFREEHVHVGNWHYLGVLASGRNTGMTFHPAEIFPECISLLGLGRPPPGREMAVRESCGPYRQ